MPTPNPHRRPEPHGLPRTDWNAAVQNLLGQFGTWPANEDTLARFFTIGAAPMDCVRVVCSAREGCPWLH